jgi:hypothetical protein
MPTINEMIANPMEYGFQGGQRKAEQDQQRREQHEIDIREKELDIKKKAAELEEHRRQTSLRRKQQRVQEQSLQRSLDNKDLLDEQQRISIQESIQKSYSSLHSSQIEEISRRIGAVKNQKSYDIFLASMDERARKMFEESVGWTPSGNWKNDQEALKYIHTIGVMSMEHNRNLEQLAIKAANSKGSGGGKKTPDPVRPFGVGDEPGIRSRLAQNPFFNPLWDTGINKYNPFADDVDRQASSPELRAVSTAVTSRANQIMTRANNLARDRNDPRLAIGQDEAFNRAMREEEILRHTTDDDGNIVPMSIEEYQKYMMASTTAMEQQMRKQFGKRWDAMPGQTKQQMIDESILYMREQEYTAALNKKAYGE